MTSVEQKSTKWISLKFPPMTSVPSRDKSNLVETSLATMTEHVQLQNAAAPILRTVLVSNIAVNQQQAEITQIVPQTLSATPTFQETPNKMISKMTQMENALSQMQANIPVLTVLLSLLLSIFLQTLLFLQEQRPFQTLFILNKTRFPCIIDSYFLSM